MPCANIGNPARRPQIHAGLANGGNLLQLSDAIAYVIYSQRLSSVTSSAGYKLTISYATDTGAGADDWYRRTGVTFTNTANPPSPAPAISYIYPNFSTTNVTDPAGRTWVFTINVLKLRLTGVRRPGSASDNISYGYNTAGMVISATKDGVTNTYEQSINGTIATETVTNSLSQQRVVTTDTSQGRPTNDRDELGHATSYEYDANARLTKITATDGNYVQYGYDARGNVTTATNVAKSGSGPSNIVTSASFDASCANIVTCNQPNSTTDAKGNVTDYTYDATHGGVLTATQPAPQSGGVRPQSRFSYTQVAGAGGQSVYMLTGISACQTLTSCTGAADEAKSSVSYNSNLLPTSLSRGDGTGALTATSAMTYDPRGRLDTVDGPLAGTADTTKFRYDNADQLIGVTSSDPDGAGALKNRAIRLTYRPNGQVSRQELGTVNSQSDPDWALFAALQTIDVAFDSNSRVASRKLSANGTDFALTQYSYDALGRLNCTAVRMNVAAFGSLPASACALGTQGSFGPDRIGQVVYDAAGQITQNRTAVGTSDEATEWTLTHSSNGQIDSLKDAEANLTTFEYDGFDRLSKTRFPVTTKGANSSSTTDYEQLTYDANSNVTSRRLRDGNSIAFAFDALNRPTLKNLPGTEPDVTYAYDNLSRLTSASQTGNALAFTWDALGRKLTEAGPQGTASSVYDLAGRRTQITYPGTGLFVNTDYLVTGEATKIRENGATSGVGVLAAYSYDNLGNRLSVTFGNGAQEVYSYDAVSRLSAFQNIIAANGYAATFTYNPANQLTSLTRGGFDTWAWTGHGNGSTDSVANGLNQQVTIGGSAATWDSKGNLTSEPQSGKTYGYSSENLLTSASGGVTLAYDPSLRLYQVAGAATTRFAYDGVDAIAEYNASNALQRRFVHGPGVDEPIVQYEGPGTTDRRFMSADERGSIIATTNSSGALLTINRYDEYGKPQSTNSGRFQYTGQKWIAELGAYDYKARVYLSHLGIFAQTDPIGGTNLYAYVGGDPVNLADPGGTGPFQSETPYNDDILFDPDNRPASPWGQHSWDWMGQMGTSVLGGYEAIMTDLYARVDWRYWNAQAKKYNTTVSCIQVTFCANIAKTAGTGSVLTGSLSTVTTVDGQDLNRSWVTLGLSDTGLVVQNVYSMVIYANGRIKTDMLYEAWPQIGGSWPFGNVDTFGIDPGHPGTTLTVWATAYYYPGVVYNPYYGISSVLVPRAVAQAGALPSCRCVLDPMLGRRAVGPVSIKFTTTSH